MTDTNKLKDMVSNKGLKYSFLAKEMGITTYCLRMKIENKTEFKTSEVQKMCELLDIKDVDIMCMIFFAKKVD